MYSSKLSTSLLLFLIPLLSTWYAHSIPLDTQHVRDAKHIILYPGTFDPVTYGHLKTGESTLRQTGADLLIFIPGFAPSHKDPLPFAQRTNLLELVLENNPQIAYAKDSQWEEIAASEGSAAKFIQNIRELNPRCKISLLVGQDVAEKPYSPVLIHSNADEILVSPRTSSEGSVRISPSLFRKNLKILNEVVSGYSSSSVRSLLGPHIELYLLEKEAREKLPAYQQLLELIPQSVLDEILARGLFVDQGYYSRASLWKTLKKSLVGHFKEYLFSINFYEKYKNLMVRARSRPNLKTVKINERTYDIKKYLGSGRSTDAYLINFEGVDVAIKIAKNEKGRRNIMRASRVHQWSQAKFNVSGPRLIDFDPGGAWLISDFIDGQDIAIYLKQNGTFSERVKESIIELHREVLRIESESHFVLDFAPDNIIIRDSRAYLVDFDPIPPGRKINNDGLALLNRWEMLYAKLDRAYSDLHSLSSKSCKFLFLLH